jgi:hypothetical protein
MARERADGGAEEEEKTDVDGQSPRRLAMKMVLWR